MPKKRSKKGKFDLAEGNQVGTLAGAAGGGGRLLLVEGVSSGLYAGITAAWLRHSVLIAVLQMTTWASDEWESGISMFFALVFLWEVGFYPL